MLSLFFLSFFSSFIFIPSFATSFPWIVRVNYNWPGALRSIGWNAIIIIIITITIIIIIIIIIIGSLALAKFFDSIIRGEQAKISRIPNWTVYADFSSPPPPFSFFSFCFLFSFFPLRCRNNNYRRVKELVSQCRNSARINNNKSPR